jgi:ABC-type transport system substrate-binding protein
MNEMEFQQWLAALNTQPLTRRKFLLLAALSGGGVSVSALLAACAPTATPTPAPLAATSIPPIAATATPVQMPTPTAKAIPRGGSVMMGMWEDPGVNLNPYIGFTLHYWMAPCLQRLVGWDPDGNPYPVLATEVPTGQNGGVSKDGKVITFHLRPNVKWADGEPFTSEDVKFTIEAVNKHYRK